MGSAPKKNWSDWIWFESDLSNQIRSNISDLQFKFSSKKFWTDQISSDQFESDQNQISSNSIQSKLIWSDSSSSNFKLKIKKMRFITCTAITEPFLFFTNFQFAYFCRYPVAVAQLVRASDCGSEGRGFETHQSPCKSPTDGDF